jgi:hypothetical protein
VPEPTNDEPTDDEPTDDEPIDDEPGTDTPDADEPTDGETAAEPTTDETAVEEPAEEPTEEPAAKERVPAQSRKDVAAAERRNRRPLVLTIVAGVVLLGLVAGLILALVGGDDGDDEAAPATTAGETDGEGDDGADVLVPGPPCDEALAVDDRSVTCEELDAQILAWGTATQLPADDPALAADAAAQWASWWVRFTALQAWAEDTGIETTDADAEAATQLIEESFPGTPVEGNPALEQLVVWQTLVERISTDEDLRAAALEANPGIAGPLLCSRHILLETEDEATEVLALLEDGGDFAELASERSTDPSAATNGGDLGCQPEGTFVPEFEEAAFAAQAGDVVGPVETQFGFHIIEVLSLEDTPEEAVQEQLTQIVQGDLVQGTSPVYAEVFTDRTVTVEARFGTWDETVLVVVPAGADLPE